MRGGSRDAGIPASTVVIRSNGGEMTLEAAANAPVHMVVSGPTGGVIAGRHVAELVGIDRLVTLDMGGTSTDVSTIVGGKESFTSAFEIEWGVPIQIPMIDIRTIRFGGAGPLHASDLMDDAGIPRTIIPNNPGQFSAFGFIMTNARVDRHRTTQLTSKRFEAARAREIVEGLAREGLLELQAQGYQQDIEIFRSLEMRYLGQNYELELPIASDALDDDGADGADGLWNLFH